MSRPWDVLSAFADELAVIATAGGYNTDIGSTIVLYDQQRASTQRPSIAIGSRSGKIDLRDQVASDGRKYSKFAREMDFVFEAGLSASSADAQRVAHDALEDIERVMTALSVKPLAMPNGVSRISLSSWSILDRPDGIDAVVLQIIGVVGYLRTPS